MTKYIPIADVILCADYILPMNHDLTVLRNGAVAVKDGRIAAVGPREEILSAHAPARIIDATGRAIFPGLVNTHTHSPMVYFRGLADDIPLKEWLEKYIWPAEQKWLGPEFVEDAVELASLEMLKAGITTVNDMYFYGNEIAATTRKMGLRAVVGAGVIDFPTKTASTVEEYLSNARDFISAWKADDLVTPCIAPHSAYTCGPETLKKAGEMAEEFAVLLHIHLSETQWEVSEILSRHGKRPVVYLDSLGLLNERVVAAHCVWVDEEEIRLLARRKVNVSHCIESNLKLASGFAPVASMLAEGVTVTLGTDGAASNNDLNILGEMSTAAKVHKALAGDTTVLDAKTVLLMATRWGAEAMGLGKVTGSIEVGKAADIVIADVGKPHLLPLYDIYSQIVYSMMPSDIETVMINGRIVMEDRVLKSADETQILSKAAEWGKRIGSQLR